MNNLPPGVRDSDYQDKAACISCGSESIEFFGEEEYWNWDRTKLVICLSFRCDKCEIEWSEQI
jgi:hypothetical protein